MYIESKDGLSGPARIVRVTLSKSRKSLHYGGRLFHRLGGQGFKANFADEDGREHWISGPRRDGQDRLYPGIVEIDEDVREEYWTSIRQRPELASNTSYRSEGRK